MKNYISINNQQIELTEEQVKRIAEAYGKGSVSLGEVPAGELVKIGDFEMIVLEQLGSETALILKDFYGEKTLFGDNNNYDGSFVDDRCRDFAAEIANIVGEDNIVLHTVDLTSDDGLKDYGTIERRASLITAEMYRKYVEILDQFNPKEWWWLATAHSTKRHENNRWAKCVSTSGGVDCNYDNRIKSNVRPFCILKSNINENVKRRVSMSKKIYIGTKIIQAEPAVRYNGCIYGIGDTMPALAVVNGEAEQGYRVTYRDGYTSWSPKATFEEAYRETMGMNFGLAVEAMKKNMRIARWDWEDKEQGYLFLANNESLHTDADLSEFEEKDIPASRILVLRTAQEALLLGYQPSIEDLLAEDWYIVDKLDTNGERTLLPF